MPCDKEIDVKIVLLGKAFVGKTTLVGRYLHNTFNINYHNTIGVVFSAKKIDVNGETLSLGIWDTVGCERYKAMSRIYYRDAGAAIVCYDLTDRDSLDRAQFWIDELKDNEENCRIYLCGTKKDLVDDDRSLRQIERGVAEALGDELNAEVFETSSKTGENIEEVFMRIAEDHLNSSAKLRSKTRGSTGSFRLLNTTESKPASKSSCCHNS